MACFRWYGYAVAVSVCICASGCGQKKDAGVKEAEIIPVRVGRVEVREFAETIECVGDIKAQDEAVVYPKVAGKITEKMKAEGSAIARGEPLVYLDRDEVGMKFELAPVESPLDGTVGKVYVDRGTQVSAQTPVALVVDMDRVKIRLDIPEKYIPAVTAGQSADITVDAYPNRVFQGSVSSVSPVVDLATRTAAVEISADNGDHALKSGMFARVKLAVRTRGAARVILKESVMGTEPEAYVYIVRDGRAVMRAVKLGIRQGPYYEVAQGLEENEAVVIMGQQRLTDGARVLMGE